MGSAAPPKPALAVVALGTELWRNRAFVLGGAVHELRRRYAGTGVGLAWHLVIPLVQATVYLLVFSALLSPPGARHASIGSYAVFLCAGLFPWFVLADCLGRGSLALVANENYLRKLPIPESVFVAQAVATAGLTLVVYALLLVALAVATGLVPRLSWLLVAPVLVLFLGLCFGLTLVLSVLVVFFRDVVQALPLLIQIWFWLTPIVYDPGKIWPWLAHAVRWNPPSAYILSVRSLLVDARVPGPAEWTWMFGLSLASIATGATILHTLRSDVRDAI